MSNIKKVDFLPIDFQTFKQSNTNDTNKSNIKSVNSSNTETMFFDEPQTNSFSASEIRQLVKDIKEYSEASAEMGMMNDKKNPIEDLSYNELNDLLDSINDSNLNTADAAVLFTEVDYCVNKFDANQVEQLTNKIDSTWREYAENNNDNTLKYIHQAYINNWYEYSNKERADSVKYGDVDSNSAIEDIYANMDDYDSTVLSSISSYGKNDSSLSSSSQDKVSTMQDYSMSQVIR